VYVFLLAALNFAFPYILLPVAINPTQLLAPPGRTRRGVLGRRPGCVRGGARRCRRAHTSSRTSRLPRRELPRRDHCGGASSPSALRCRRAPPHRPQGSLAERVGPSEPPRHGAHSPKYRGLRPATRRMQAAARAETPREVDGPVSSYTHHVGLLYAIYTRHVCVAFGGPELLFLTR